MPARITIISDDEAILSLYKMLLEAESHRIDTAQIIFEHPTDIERLHPDLIVLDIKYGRQTAGWQMLEKLCLYRPTASIPLIVCTAAIREAQEQESQLRQRGINVVYKPFDLDDFVHAVEDALDARMLPA